MKQLLRGAKFRCALCLKLCRYVLACSNESYPVCRTSKGRSGRREGRGRGKGRRGAKEAKRCAVWHKIDAPSSYLFVPSGIRLPRADILRRQDIELCSLFFRFQPVSRKFHAATFFPFFRRSNRYPEWIPHSLEQFFNLYLFFEIDEAIVSSIN